MNYKNDLEDELLQRAFDADEDFPLPENYILDEMNTKSVEFLKKVQNERKLIDSKMILVDTEDIEFSLNVDNTSKFSENYMKLKISNQWINDIKKEFFRMKNELESQLKNPNSHLSQHTHSHPHMKNFNFNEIVSSYKLQKENVRNIPIPNGIIISNLIGRMTNKICIKLISHFEKLLLEKIPDISYTITIWIYFLLIMLKTPLVDEDNSVLYSLNKTIVSHMKLDQENSINKKLIHVIISEIFSQKIMNI